MWCLFCQGKKIGQLCVLKYLMTRRLLRRTQPVMKIQRYQTIQIGNSFETLLEVIEAGGWRVTKVLELFRGTGSQRSHILKSTSNK
ncbi:hypothetical protein NPIL_476321 [Nephila pilipes]|uniref:Uncharacterized protein n=1 Tax=Nephila pilipes TaxID=299642 RepID=A0A8X6PZF0_NEPPI|nr:hypothetical protein NPIL_476321 [Nephila pilipes]